MVIHGAAAVAVSASSQGTSRAHKATTCIEGHQTPGDALDALCGLARRPGGKMATPPPSPQWLPVEDLVELRRIVGRRFRPDDAPRRDVVTVLMLPDQTLAAMAQIANAALGIAPFPTVSELAGVAPALASYEQWLVFSEAVGLRRRAHRHVRWQASTKRGYYRDAEPPAPYIGLSLAQLRRRWANDGVPQRTQQRWAGEFLARQLAGVA